MAPEAGLGAWSACDPQFMRRALELAAGACGRTAPNPMVGAVVVAPGDAPQVLGEGFHPKAGEPHAEVFALREAGERARGATLYVTLEPCCHHGRTPPCADAVIAAGIRRVVAAMGDPFPRVAGGGFQRLREAGVRVEVGLLEQEAREMNRAYLKAVRTGLPWVTLKMAVTLDGKVATRTGDSRWITGELARERVHRLRDEHDAVMVGSGTMRQDDPQLTTRIPGGRHAVRVVVSSRPELPSEGYLARTAGEIPTVLLSSSLPAPEALASGVRVVAAPNPSGGVDLERGLRALVEQGLHSVLCEGGPGLAGSLLDAGLVDEVWWFLAPKLVGGAAAPSALGGRGVERMAEALVLRNATYHPFGPDLAVHGFLGDGGQGTGVAG